MLCQLPLGPWDEDPRSQLFLGNLMSYLATRPEPTPPPSRRPNAPGSGADCPDHCCSTGGEVMTSPKPHLPILTSAAFVGAVALASLALRPSPARAEADPAGDAPATTSTTPTTKSGAPATQPGTQPADGRVSVAVLDFASTTPGNPDLGSQIGKVLVATLSGESGFQLVDRSTLARVLQEHELNATGLVGAEQAAKIGKLVGTRILVTGKAFALDKQVFITAKLIGTETSLVDGIIVKGSKEADTATLVMELSQKIAERLRTAGPKLVAADEALTDPLPGLKAKLAGRKLPKVSVAITEQHVTAAQAARVDPAVETEVKNILIAAGFTVVEGNGTTWTRPASTSRSPGRRSASSTPASATW